MKKRIVAYNLHIVLLVLLSLLIISCKKAPTTESVSRGSERAITIVNNTGSQIKGYQVNVAGSGVEITRGVSSTNSFPILINDKFENDLRIEVVIVDIFERIYTKTFDVPLEGNTDTPVTAADRVSEGLLTDKWKDLTAWMNTHKGGK